MTAVDDHLGPVGLADRPESAGPRFVGARLLAVATAVVLLTTACLLWFRLPHVTVADHWALAWAGLDVATATTAGATAALLRFGSARAGLTAAAGAALLITDAWFDMCTATPGAAHVVAVLEATLVELPVAGLAIWLALRILPGPARHGPRVALTSPGAAILRGDGHR